MSQFRFLLLLQGWEEQRLTPQEEKTLFLFLAKSDHRRLLVEDWMLTGILAQPQQTHNRTFFASMRRPWILSVLSLAASLMVIVAIFQFTIKSDNQKPILVPISIQDQTKILLGEVIQAPKNIPLQMLYSDGTKLILQPGSALLLRDTSGDKQNKLIELTHGTVMVKATPQPVACPMLIRTREASVQVVGTRLQVSVVAGHTRVEVMKGTVQVERRSDNVSIRLTAGHTVSVFGNHPLVADLAQPKTEAIRRFSLFDPGTGKVVPGYEDLHNGALISLSALPAGEEIMLLIDASPKFQGGVLCQIAGKQPKYFSKKRPYLFFGAATRADQEGIPVYRYNRWLATPGRHRFVVTPLNKRGKAVGKPAALTLVFTR